MNEKSIKHLVEGSIYLSVITGTIIFGITFRTEHPETIPLLLLIATLMIVGVRYFWIDAIIKEIGGDKND